jgi:methylmalonyl-CoA mutase C-terminal domain/subunit
MQRKIRVLVGKPGLDGHDRGAKVVAAALRDAGMEVIYTGLHQTPEQIVEAAVQEDVDVVALSVLSGAHMTLFSEIHGLMRERGIGDRLLTGGGIIPNEDMATLAERGVGKLFGPGTNTHEIVGYIREWYSQVHGADALPPLPPPLARPEPMAPISTQPRPTPARPRATPAAAKPRASATATRSRPARKRASAPAKRKARKAGSTSTSRNGGSATRTRAGARRRVKPAAKRSAAGKRSRPGTRRSRVRRRKG